MRKRLIVISLLCVLFTSTLISAETHVISNSKNWEDVYSSMIYASISGLGSDFFTNSEQASGVLWDIINHIDKKNDLFIISSKNNPIISNYQTLNNLNDFDRVEEIKVSSANLDLISRLPHIENFIIVEDSYGYSALAVVAYALASESWVFLVNKENIADIDEILGYKSKNVLIYGYLSPELMETFSKYNPEIINTGDKYQDNIEIIKKYSKIGSIKQVILGDGEFIEKEIMQGKNALLFTGKENVPPKIVEYLRSSEVEMGVLIGNEWVGTASNIRQSTGINVIVKFSRSSRETTVGVAPVEELDLFYITSPNIKATSYPKYVEEPKKKNEVETTTDVTSTRISPISNESQYKHEKDSDLKNNLFLPSLIIGIAIIVGFAILAFTLKKK